MTSDSSDFEMRFYEGIVKQSPLHFDALLSLAEVYTRKGLYVKGLEMDQRLSKLRPQDPVIQYNLACSYALVGAKEEALLILQRAIRLGYRDFSHIKKDSDLRSLKDDPRFQDLLRAFSKTREKKEGEV